MDKNEVAKILEEIALFLELKGENPFKSHAYSAAARAIESLDTDINQIVAESRLESIKGVGKSIAAKVTELVTSGKLSYYEELRAEIPQGLLEMLQIPGMGPKRIKTVYDKLGVKSIEQLEIACEQKKLETLEGFGVKTEEKILAAIANFKKHKELFRYNIAYLEAETLADYLTSSALFEHLTIAGSLRRKKEVTKDIDLLAASRDREKAMAYFTQYPQANSITAQGKTKSSLLLKSGLNADLRMVEVSEYPYALHHFTGGKEHNVAMRSRAQKKYNLKMNEYGLFKNDTELIKCKSEEEIFAHLGLAYIPPELRENLGEIEAAERNELPNLLTEADLKGIIHAHTTASDGVSTLLEMAEETQRLGFHYLGITEHSQSAAGYAHGLKEERLVETWAEIDRYNKNQKHFKIFKGIESDIKTDGSLDYSPEILKEFDFVIASIHSGFSQDETEMTKRVIKALENEYTTILGHPTGRLLLIRDGYPINMKKVIEAAAANGKAIELNSNPMRLDIDWREIHYAKKLGVKIVLCPDAHSVKGLSDIFLGVGIARKGWLERGDVLNCLDLEEIEAYFI